MEPESIRLDNADLSVEQLLLLLDTLPIDLTFIDEHDVVRFHSRYRIFDRPSKAIGTDVSECHSAGTRPGVAQVISELASGWRESADFLVEKDGRAVSVRYLPVRDSDGGHRGILEIARYLDDVEAGPEQL
jgi:DUF438 domain-containing protein